MSPKEQKTLRKEDASLLSGRGRYADESFLDAAAYHEAG